MMIQGLVIIGMCASRSGAGWRATDMHRSMVALPIVLRLVQLGPQNYLADPGSCMESVNGTRTGCESTRWTAFVAITTPFAMFFYLYILFSFLLVGVVDFTRRFKMLRACGDLICSGVECGSDGEPDATRPRRG